MPKNKVNSIKKMSELTGVKRDTLSYLMKAGHLTHWKKVGNSYIFDEKETIKELVEHRKTYPEGNYSDKINKRLDELIDGTPKKPPRQTQSKMTAAEAKRRQAIIAAQKAQFELDVLKGKFVDKQKTEVEAYELGRQTRDAVMAVPERVAAICAGETSEHEVLRILQRELRSALESVIK